MAISVIYSNNIKIKMIKTKKIFWSSIEVLSFIKMGVPKIVFFKNFNFPTINVLI